MTHGGFLGACAADISSELAPPALQIQLVEASMAKTAVGLFENPGSADQLVRDLEDSGYPVDGSREQFIRRPDGLSIKADAIALTRK